MIEPLIPAFAGMTSKGSVGVSEAASAWPSLLECLLLTVGNLRCSGFDRQMNAVAVEAELEAWRQSFEPQEYEQVLGPVIHHSSFITHHSPKPHDHEQVLRLKATLERAKRLADNYRDTILRLFPQSAARLGQALGVPEPTIKVYAESEIRSHVVFQLAKMLSFSLKILRELAGLSPWEVIVPGSATGVLVMSSPSLEQLPSLRRESGRHRSHRPVARRRGDPEKRVGCHCLP